MSRNTLIVTFIIGLAVIAIVMTHHTAHAANHPTAKPHGWNMEHCMPGMDAHCRMNQAMGQMEKEMDQHRTMEHCMPNMTAHCQAIADLEYMEKRMENMRVYMQHCMENEKDCPMPEMTGEMKAMRDRMDAMSKEMQEKMQPKHDEKGQIDTLHERAESHGKP
jgi:hypothetical protein